MIKMDKHTSIVVIASIIIAIPFAYSFWNIYALENLQFRGTDDGRFSLFDMINSGSIEVCNPNPFLVNYNEFNIITYFEGREKGIYSSEKATIPPVSSVVINGTFSSETFPEAQYLALHFDGMFSDSAPERIDPRKLIMITQVEAPIIGVIPYSITNEYSGLFFWDTLNGKIGEFNC